jgi:hypothetical protein
VAKVYTSLRNAYNFDTVDMQRKSEVAARKTYKYTQISICTPWSKQKEFFGHRTWVPLSGNLRNTQKKIDTVDIQRRQKLKRRRGIYLYP